MKYLLPLSFLLLIALPIQAEIYRSVDEDGNVIYSDQELPNSELIPTPTDNTVSMPKPEASAPAEEKKEKPTGNYHSFSIVSPDHNAVIRNNAGNITVNLSIDPPLKVGSGDYIRLYLDDEEQSSKLTSSSTQLSNIARGSHTLRAELRNASGKTLKSASIQFHLKRISVLH
ncbi:MAG: DUF4124 domain-containing protein [Gammaproteobacteria bacterium]|nr:DUF4124 domain-containing protein [Gammaproteobacteria bacterium]